MSRSNRSAILVSLVGAVLAGGLGIAYLQLWQPRKQAAAAQQEVSLFAPSWSETRACLIGSSPRSSVVGEAMNASELIRGDRRAELIECRSRLVASGRKDGYSTGLDDIEKAWSEFRKVRSKLATALAYRVAKHPTRSLGDLRVRLAEAATAVDDAYQNLRAAAGLKPDRLSGKALVVPDSLPAAAALGSAPSGGVRVESNRLRAIRLDTEPRTLVIRTETSERVLELDEEATLAVGPQPWSIELTDGTLQLRAPDLAEGSKLMVDPPQATIDDVFGAIGDAAGQRVVVVHSYDGAKTTQLYSNAPGQPFAASAIGSELNGFAGVTSVVSHMFGRVYLQGNGKTLIWRAHSLPTPSLLVAAGPPCLAETADWWLREFDLVYSTSTSKSSTNEQPSNEQSSNEQGGIVANSSGMPWQKVACSDQQLIGTGFGEGATIQIRVCEADACRISTRIAAAPGARFHPLISPKHGPMIAVSLDQMLVVWAQDPGGKGLAPRGLIRTGKAAVVGLVEWGGQLSAVVSIPSNEHQMVRLLPIDLRL